MEKQELEKILNKDKKVKVRFRNNLLEGEFKMQDQLDALKEKNKWRFKVGNQSITLEADEIISVEELKEEPKE